MGIKPTCREIHQLVSERLDRPLTIGEQVRVRLHFLVCETCTRFDGQMQTLRRAMKRLAAGDDAGPGSGPGSH